MQKLNKVCEERRETLSKVLSFLCVSGDADAIAILNEVMGDTATRKGVKRAMADLVGEDTYAKYVKSLRVRDWVLLFKMKSRISANTWQSHRSD